VSRPFTPALLLIATLLAACAGGAVQPEETREHDARTFAVDPAALPFPALDNVIVETDRWSGVLGGAGYRVEVPRRWNGKLVMYAHGYAGTGPVLAVSNPSIRRHLIENGYAWAASSYSKNYYDVRAGVEDTNALALAFTKIAAANGRPLPAPTKTYLIGHSMGGHIAAAAIEDEAYATARHKQRYDGAVPMCGVVGDTELFNYFRAYQAAAQALAGLPRHPLQAWAEINEQVRSRLFTRFTGPTLATTPQGDRLREVVKHLTGGRRPIFDQGFSLVGVQQAVWGTFGGDGRIDGILNKSVIDTTAVVLQLDDHPALSREETELNTVLMRQAAEPEANRLRRDGLRWIPKVNGEFKVPVVSLHTLGDLYVPFHMQQLYRQRAEAKGNGHWLVQRAIRAPSHCDFTVAEQVAAFDAMVTWAETGVKPAGDDVRDKAAVASPAYGCRFTVNTPTLGEPTGPGSAVATRAYMPRCP